MFIKGKERHEVQVTTKNGNVLTYFVKASSINKALREAQRVAKQHKDGVKDVVLYDGNHNIISVSRWA